MTENKLYNETTMFTYYRLLDHFTVIDNKCKYNQINIDEIS